MNTPASNIRVVSNVYPVKTVQTRRLRGFPDCREGVYDDPGFRKQIRGKAALKKLAKETCGTTILESDDRQNLVDRHLVADWQIEIYWDQEGSGNCVDCKPGERPIGIIRTGERCKVINRCENPLCRCRPGQREAKKSP
jgi:hypothetical protein